MKRASQPARLLAYLEQHPEGITTLEAAYMKPPICRLSERVRELERKSIPIDREKERTENAIFTRYRLIKVAYG
jgi:hypothetical protein